MGNLIDLNLTGNIWRRKQHVITKLTIDCSPHGVYQEAAQHSFTFDTNM